MSDYLMDGKAHKLNDTQHYILRVINDELYGMQDSKEMIIREYIDFIMKNDQEMARLYLLRHLISEGKIHGQFVYKTKTNSCLNEISTLALKFDSPPHKDILDE